MQREHFARFGGVRADVTADKWVRVFGQSHPWKIKFMLAKSESK